MTSFFKPTNPALSVSFPDQMKPHTAGEHIGGTAHLRLDRDSKGQLEFDSVTAKLRVMMTTTSIRVHHNRAGSNTASRQKRTETNMLYGTVILLFDAKTYTTALEPSISIPFGFILPPAQQRLPPSFQGGERARFGGRGNTLGDGLCSVTWSIKITARKTSTFSRNERLSFPFIYFQPPIQANIPPQICPLPSMSGVLPPYPPAVPLSPAFQTLVLSHPQRPSSFFGSKKGKVMVRFSLPASPTFPSFYPIPYRISILVLSHPLSEKFSPSPSSPPPELLLPSPSALRLQLIRQVSSRAQGTTDVIDQRAGDLMDLSKEHRVWYCEPRLMEDPEARGTFRWGSEIVCVGEFVLGTGSTTGAGLTIWPESTMGLLSSHFTVDLALPMKGLGNDLAHDNLVSFAITSPLPSVAGSPPVYQQTDIFPPGYLDSRGNDDDSDDGK